MRIVLSQPYYGDAKDATVAHWPPLRDRHPERVLRGSCTYSLSLTFDFLALQHSSQQQMKCFLGRRDTTNFRHAFPDAFVATIAPTSSLGAGHKTDPGARLRPMKNTSDAESPPNREMAQHLSCPPNSSFGNGCLYRFVSMFEGSSFTAPEIPRRHPSVATMCCIPHLTSSSRSRYVSSAYAST